MCSESSCDILGQPLLQDEQISGVHIHVLHIIANQFGHASAQKHNLRSRITPQLDARRPSAFCFCLTQVQTDLQYMHVLKCMSTFVIFVREDETSSAGRCSRCGNFWLVSACSLKSKSGLPLLRHGG